MTLLKGSSLNDLLKYNFITHLTIPLRSLKSYHVLMDTPHFRAFIERCFVLAQEQDLSELDEIEQLLFDEWEEEIDDWEDYSDQ